jgi:acyl-[acyl-carrier-protein] desaturase
MKRVAADENLHYLFYRDLVSAALDIDPSGMTEAITRQVLNFEMPGTGIPGFTRHAKAIARAGIYDLKVHHDLILRPVVLGHWDIAGRQDLTQASTAAQDRLIQYISRLGRASARLNERRVKPELDPSPRSREKLKTSFVP